MTTYLPKDVRDGLDDARRMARARKSRLRVQVGERIVPVVRFWDNGFALDIEVTPRLRGLVDVYDGARHMCQCLIVASSEEAGEVVYDFKRSTRATDVPPADFAVEPGRPVGLIARD